MLSFVQQLSSTEFAGIFTTTAPSRCIWIIMACCSTLWTSILGNTIRTGSAHALAEIPGRLTPSQTCNKESIALLGLPSLCQMSEDTLALALASSYDLEMSQPSSPNTRGHTSKLINENRLIQEIVQISSTEIKSLLEKHRTAVMSARNVESYPLYFFMYCLIEMERNGEVIDGVSLFSKCDELLEGLPSNFIEKLTVKLKAVRLPNYEDLMNSDFYSRHRNGGLVPIENGSRASESDLGGSDEDTVDSLTIATTGSLLLQDSLMILSSMPEATLEYPNATSTKASSKTRRGEHQARRTGSQTNASLVQKKTQGGDSREPEAKEREANSRIQEKLFAMLSENKLLENCKQCVKCHDKPRNITFLPCGHFTMCRECAGPTYVCSACNKRVLATVDTFLC